MPLFTLHDDSRDDLKAPRVADKTTPQLGWDPSGNYNKIQTGEKTTGSDEAHGGAARVNQYQADVARSRERGAQTRPAIQVDETQADGARQLQMGGLGMLRQQATGEAPSSAAILSQRANQGAAQAMGSAGLTKGGPGAAIAAQSRATPAAAQGAMAMNAQNADRRAGEISRGQAAFAGGALGVQGQDIAAATTNAQLEAQQRAVDEQHQQSNERLAWDTEHTRMANRLEYRRQTQTAAHNQAQALSAEAAQDYNEAMGWVGMGAGAVSGGLSGAGSSDPRAKTNVIDMGSLSSLRRNRR